VQFCQNTRQAKDFDDQFLHARNLSVLLLSGLRHAGVFSGLDSESKESSRRPTRHKARWVF
jgi:hypothetical protein